ncbi:MAG: sodium:solute symporter [Planctomycetaceae bacterium]|nr:sodium:solute symporter [Planctomycetaceae bacterium]
MKTIDWIIFGVYLLTIIAIGVSKGVRSRTTQQFLLADRRMPWWAIGLSVMATQASAITFIGTTGKAYNDGMKFIHFYLGLPLAMVILCVTLVPLYHRMKVYTAYEYLGRRFDEKTRLLSSILFLISRALALGVVVYAPSVVLAMLLNWDLKYTILLMASVAIAYTVLGGIQAVIWTDVFQMMLMFGGLVFCGVWMVIHLPEGVAFGDAMHLAGTVGHLNALDLSFDPKSKYTLWAGLIGGTFLFLAYFGCDQSQAQRLLTSRSLRDTRLSLIFNAFLKLPMQFAILLIGVLLFAFLQFADQPQMHFNPKLPDAITHGEHHDDYTTIETSYGEAFAVRRQAAQSLIDARPANDAAVLNAAQSAYRTAHQRVVEIRADADRLVKVHDDAYEDTNYVFPTYVLTQLPVGIVGLIIAVVFAAAMSSIDSELNALSTSSTMDIYRRHIRTNAGDRHYIWASRLLTLLWGLIAAGFALYAKYLGSVIEAVNQVGSYFYGSLLGVFVLALAYKRGNGHGAFWGLIAGMITVCIVGPPWDKLEKWDWFWSQMQDHHWLKPDGSPPWDVAWLWLNPIACAAVLVVGIIVSELTRSPDDRDTSTDASLAD